MGRRYNEWMYRVRGRVFDAVVARHFLPGGRPSPAPGAAPFKVLDVGAGTGFYVDRWLALGGSVTGVDLTDVAVDRLRERFPTVK